ncbi:MAG: alanine racemase [Oscillospiraceae bacterium]|nr:alanine racemase [Oscillospiraceae bacterium]MDY4192247.1 alanine racemase [Oscillospiraceae bacterium]
MAGHSRRTWAEIDLDCLSRNFHIIRSRVRPGCRLMAVVKANAYGHGDGPVARALEALGADWFAVSSLEEAVSLRRQGTSRPILVLGYTPPEDAPLLSRYKVSQAVLDEDFARALSREAAAAGVEVDCHLKLDTGMGRIGFSAAEDRAASSREAILRAAALPGLRFTGVFTHFSCADSPDEDSLRYTQLQYRRFTGMLEALGQDGLFFSLRHCCNSAGLLAHPEWHMDMVRAGVILYGLSPSPDCPCLPRLEPVMSLRSVVSLVKEAEAGDQISYGRTYTAPGPRTLATVPIGYADGYSRLLSGRGEMSLRGRRAPVAGRVCMDQLMLDVTGLGPVRPGDPVTVFGRPEDGAPTADGLAALIGTIGYEVVCGVSRRVPRVYVREGAEVGAENYLLPGGLR